MSTQIVPLSPELLPAVLRFAARVWTRPRSAAFHRWRYEDPPFHQAFVAMRDGECLAMESAFRHPYRVGDEIVDFLEVFDWFCLPELRNSGLGVRIMQRFMREPSPLLLVGGTPDTRGLLPRLRWEIVGQASRWILPIGLERAARSLARRGRMPLSLARRAAPVARAVSGRRPQRRVVPEGGRVFAVAMPGEELFRLQRGPLGYRTLPLWTPELLRWLVAGFAGVGRFLPFYFARNGSLRGFALLRIYPSADGCDAEVVDLFAPYPDPDLYAWMVSELVVVSDGFAAGRVAATTTCTAVQEALRRNHFEEAAPNPIQVWWPGGGGLPSPILVGSNTGDSPILPLAESWWDSAAPGEICALERSV